MKTKVFFIVSVFILIALGDAPRIMGVSYAQGEVRYYPETGHSVSGAFLEKYLAVDEPELLFGYPITEAFNDKRGLLVQYFQKVRFEQAKDGKVTLTPVGEILYVPGKSLPVLNSSACRVVGEKRVCYTFLEFFDAYGGAAQFGNPISEFEIFNDRIVQYFEFARFEWYPSNPPGQRVLVADLGEVLFDLNKEDVRLLDPVKPQNEAITVLSLQTSAFVTRATTAREDTQTLFVIVKDQNRQPVSNAEVRFDVRYPNGSSKSFVMPAKTNQAGFTFMSFPVSSSENGVVEVMVTVIYDTQQKTTRTSFRIWY
ncbi:MAG: hypothetical protein OHK0052_09370 [Anaerolineales bacterium]